MYLPDMSSSNSTNLPKLAQRAQDYIDILKQPSDFAWKGELYDKDKNPSGTIKLATAENSLLTTELLEYLNAHFELTPSHLKYRWTLLNGYERSIKHVLPEYFSTYFKPRISILPEHCVHGDGIGSLLAQVIWALCEPGDGVLMATPYYDSYPRDIVYPAQAKVIPAYIPSSVDPLSTDSLPYLRAALEKPENRIRVIIFCNPHNPLAASYPRQMILEYARLAKEFDVHLLVDEVYGLQVFSSRYVPDPPPFISILSLDIQALAGCDPSRIHVVAGPTKDFGSSGLKVGSLISQRNPDLLLLVERAVQAIPMSSASDALFTRVLSDVSFRDWFLEENRRRLSKAFEVVGDWCTYHKLPFVPASAGVFFVVDLAPLLGRVASPGATAYEQTVAGFRAMQNAGVYIVPMTISADPVVTRYRMTFTLPPETMLLALRRIEDAFKLSHWESRM
ncbi:hypothetical protein FRC07_005388 [Ceratobasidium sp. 392]|nr:hypothetical protein FRC07_005388 [Ceratobasidium sp. 392]